jgi:hypothetical protein
MEVVQMAFKVFLSHSSKDDDYAKFIFHVLSEKGIEVFLDDYSIDPGQVIWQRIKQWLPTADVFALLLSKEAASSLSVSREIGMAENKIAILPIAIEPVALPAGISDIKAMPLYEDPSGWLQWLSSHLEQKKFEKERREAIWAVAAVIGGLWVLNEMLKK